MIWNDHQAWNEMSEATPELSEDYGLATVIDTSAVLLLPTGSRVLKDSAVIGMFCCPFAAVSPAANASWAVTVSPGSITM